MASTTHTLEELALQRVAHEYALGLDLGDGARFADAFLPEGALHIYFGVNTEEHTETRGREALVQLPSMLTSRYEQTLHFLGQCVYDVSDEDATGYVYCLAHHFNDSTDGGLDLCMHMTYRDMYKRDASGAWKIDLRVGHVRWSELRATTPGGLT
jgi:hypothetical protein